MINQITMHSTMRKIRSSHQLAKMTAMSAQMEEMKLVQAQLHRETHQDHVLLLSKLMLHNHKQLKNHLPSNLHRGHHICKHKDHHTCSQP